MPSTGSTPRWRASPARTSRCPTPPTSRSWRCLRSQKSSRRQRRSATGEAAMATFDPLKAPPTALEKGGTEVLRAAIVEGGLHVSLRRAFDDPEAWGMLIADVTRHVARIYRTEANMPEDRTI